MVQKVLSIVSIIAGVAGVAGMIISFVIGSSGRVIIESVGGVSSRQANLAEWSMLLIILAVVTAASALVIPTLLGHQPRHTPRHHH